jgi:hypothetical protein
MGINVYDQDQNTRLPYGSDGAFYLVDCDECGTGENLGGDDGCCYNSGQGYAWFVGIAFADVVAAILKAGWINDDDSGDCPCWICPTCQQKPEAQHGQ